MILFEPTGRPPRRLRRVGRVDSPPGTVVALRRDRPTGRRPGREPHAGDAADGPAGRRSDADDRRPGGPGRRRCPSLAGGSFAESRRNGSGSSRRPAAIRRRIAATGRDRGWFRGRGADRRPRVARGPGAPDPPRRRPDRGAGRSPGSRTGRGGTMAAPSTSARSPDSCSTADGTATYYQFPGTSTPGRTSSGSARSSR